MRRGLPAFTLVGLPDRAVRESRERVRAAVQNSRLDFPMKRLTVNLAPAHVRKAGPGFDLAIAVGLLAASGQVPHEALVSTAVCGELSLSGELRPVRGTLAAAMGAREAGCERMLVPHQNAPEATLVDGLKVIGAGDLQQIARLLRGEGRARPDTRRRPRRRPRGRGPRPSRRSRAGGREAGARDRRGRRAQPPDGRSSRRGQDHARPAAPGDPARRPGSTRPSRSPRCTARPGSGRARSCASAPSARPHHTISAQGLVGGGGLPRPGEVTLAHRGVLFLDELAEFSRMALDALRQPLEEGLVHIMRGQRALEFPANPVLVAACNRCPCGRAVERCRCSTTDRDRYLRRLSLPLLDRLDLVCEVRAVPPVELAGRPPPGPVERRGEEAGDGRPRAPAQAARGHGRVAATQTWTAA